MYKRLEQLLMEGLSGASRALLKVRRDKARWDRIPFREKGVMAAAKMAGSFSKKESKLLQGVPQNEIRKYNRATPTYLLAKMKAKDDRMKRQDRYWRPGR